MSVLHRQYLVNETSDDGWVQLSPFGDFPNSRGMQRVRPEDANAIVNDFNSPVNLEARALGLPWYVGHPDDRSFANKYPDQKAKGRIKKLAVRSDMNCPNCLEMSNENPCPEHGLFAKVKWNSEGKQLIKDEAFHGHSVNWRVKQDGPVFRPTSLKSVGFTNDPQIPVAPVTSVNEKANMNTLMDWIKKLLGKENSVDFNETTAVNEMDAWYNTKCKPAMDAQAATMKNEAEAKTAVTALNLPFGDTPVIIFLANEVVRARGAESQLTQEKISMVNERDAASGKVTTLETEKQTWANEKATLTTERDSAKTSLVNERKVAAAALGEYAVASGRLTKAQEAAFVNEATENFSNARTKLAAMPATWRPQTQAIDMKKRHTTDMANAKERSEKVHEFVNEKMATKKWDYNRAFAAVKAEHPDLFTQMTESPAFAQ